MKRLLSMTALGSLLAAALFFAVQPAWAGVDERIQALEQELAQLKTDQSQLQGDQMELRKEATAAEAKLPEFRYRQRSGLRIRAADRSWEITFHYVFHGRIGFFPDAQDAADGSGSGRASGTFFGRRNRPGMTMKFNDGFYEILWRHDADAGDFAIQDSTFFVHFERINPWLPYFQIGMDNSATLNWHDSNWSSSTSGHFERSMLVRNNGINTAGSHTGFGLVWDDVAIGPGSYTLEGHYIQAIGGSDGVGTDTDRKDFYTFIGAKPCEKCKSKWVEGIDIGLGLAFGNVDSRTSDGTNRRLRLRDHQMVADPGDNRITLFDIDNIGDGMHTYITPGFGWQIGPYRFRSAAGFDGWDGKEDGNGGRVGARFFSIAHELFVWSPKGFMTGDSNGPHSVMVSWMFERDDAWCRESRGLGSSPCGDNSGEFSRNRVLLRELDIWWFIQRNVSVGFAWMWYDASNVREEDQRAIGCKRRGAEVSGKGCDWHSFVLGLRVGF